MPRRKSKKMNIILKNAPKGEKGKVIPRFGRESSVITCTFWQVGFLLAVLLLPTSGCPGGLQTARGERNPVL